MLKRITLHNFMSHSHTVIDLSEGLTVLTGPNNCGKSAFVSALQNLIENTKGNYMIRHGAKECRVIVETDDGHTIEWKRKKKTAGYIIDGEFRRNLDEKFLAKVLRLSKVKSGDSYEFDVHFGTQKSPIFLLGEPGSRAARFFASSSDASKLIEMQKLHRNKVLTAQQELKQQQALIKNNIEILETLAPIPDLEVQIENLEQVYSILSSEQKKIQDLESLIFDMARTSEKVSHLQQQVATLDELPRELKIENEKPLETLVDRWGGSVLTANKMQAVTQTLDLLIEPPLIKDEVSIASLVRGVANQLKIIQLSTIALQTLEGLSDPPEITNSQKLEKLIDQLVSAELREQQHNERVEILLKCNEPPQMIDEGALAIHSQQWETSVAELQQLTRRHAEIEAEYELIRSKLIHWAKENPICPTCGEHLKPENFIKHAETGLRGHIHGS